MDDVIFAGNAARSALKGAEVAPMPDGGSFPGPVADLATVQVTHHIQRGSGSSYQVNGRDVQARDVQMLLADLARGAPLRDGGQDRVGVLAPARPEAQHGLLDGAVGVASLHARWTEMEGKLRAVEANLLRAGDRWRAMDAQLDGLGRQAERDRVRSTRTTDVE